MVELESNLTQQPISVAPFMALGSRRFRRTNPPSWGAGKRDHVEIAHVQVDHCGSLGDHRSSRNDFADAARSRRGFARNNGANGRSVYVELAKVAWVCQLQPGRYSTQTNGFEPWRVRLTLAGGKTRELVPQLKRQDLRGTLTIASPVAGALVEVDGRTAGTAPVELRVAPGEHSITLRHADYQTASSPVVLLPKERRSISSALQQSPRIYERWWFWTGVGTAVATGVALGIVLSTERAPAKGDIPPGQLTSSLVAW
jgi:hypothetical protein